MSETQIKADGFNIPNTWIILNDSWLHFTKISKDCLFTQKIASKANLPQM